MNRRHSPGRLMLLCFVLYAAVLWGVDTLFEFLWFNESNEGFLDLLFAFGDQHELLMRFMMISSLVLGGAVVSVLYTRVSRSEGRLEKARKSLKLYSIPSEMR